MQTGRTPEKLVAWFTTEEMGKKKKKKMRNGGVSGGGGGFNVHKSQQEKILKRKRKGLNVQ